MKPLLHWHFARSEVFHSPLLWQKAYVSPLADTEFVMQLPFTLMASDFILGASVLGRLISKSDRTEERQTLYETRKDNRPRHAPWSWTARKTFDPLSFIATDNVLVFLGFEYLSPNSVALTLLIFWYPLGGIGPGSFGGNFVVFWYT